MRVLVAMLVPFNIKCNMHLMLFIPMVKYKRQMCNSI